MTRDNVRLLARQGTLYPRYVLDLPLHSLADIIVETPEDVERDKQATAQRLTEQNAAALKGYLK